MRIAILFGLILLTAGCKAPNSQSQIQSVVSPDGTTGKYIVYFKETSGSETVYRKSCSPNQVQAPGQCTTEPSSAARPWKDYEKALLSTGLTPTTVNGIKEAMESQTAWDVQGQPEVVKKMDKAFGIDTTTTTNPFTVAFVGAPTNGAAPVPVESTSSMPLAKDLVLAEMKDAADYFTAGNTQFRGSTHPFPQDAIVSGQVRQACLDNGTAINYWSDIVFHYYCQFGQLRGCFTGQARNNTKTYDGYKKSYDYCIANDQSFKRYFDGNVSGVDYDRRRVIFQHIMFSVYANGRTDVFDQNDQDEVINKFYDSASNCSNRPYIPRASSDPLFRTQGSHCSNPNQNSNSNSASNTSGSNSGLCSEVGSSTLTMKIQAPANASVACLFDNKSFASAATFDSSSGYWSCSPWSLGNPSYKLNVRVNGTDHFTDENAISAVPCTAGNSGGSGTSGSASGATGTICTTSDSNKVYFQTSGSSTDTFVCRFAQVGGTFGLFGQSPAFDSTTGRWKCSAWTRGNTNYTIRLIRNGQEMDTDETQGLANPCP